MNVCHQNLPFMGSIEYYGLSIDSETLSALGFDETGKEVLGTPPVVSNLSFVLERWVLSNEKKKKKNDRITIFHGSRPPSVTIRQYLERICKYSRCNSSCFVVAYAYLDRFVQKMGALVTSLNAHRLLVTSIMVASKYLDNQGYNNAYYAKIGGVSLEELNQMEIEFLGSLDFQLHVTAETFKSYCLKLERSSRELHNNWIGQSVLDPKKTWHNRNDSERHIPVARQRCAPM